MKIKQNLLNNFLNIMQLDTVYSTKLTFGSEGLYSRTMCEAGTHFAEGLLKKESFEDYEEIGVIAIDNLPQLVKALKRLGDKTEVTIKTLKNELIFETSKKHLNVKLTEEKFIKDVREFPDIKYEESFIIDCKDIKEFITDVKINKDFTIIIKTDKNKAELTNTGDYKFSHIIIDENIKGGQLIKFGSPLIAALQNFKDGSITVTVETDEPLTANHTTEHYSISLLVAPYVSNS